MDEFYYSCNCSYMKTYIAITNRHLASKSLYKYAGVFPTMTMLLQITPSQGRQNSKQNKMYLKHHGPSTTKLYCRL